MSSQKCLFCLQNEQRIKELEAENDRLKKILSPAKLYPHTMCWSKIKVLMQIHRINRSGHEWVKVQQDSNLIKDNERDFTIQIDAVHATRLNWFGLVERKGRRSGLYKINEQGINFLKGTFGIPSKIWVSKGIVMKKEDSIVFVKDVKNVVLDKEYWDEYAQTRGGNVD